MVEKRPGSAGEERVVSNQTALLAVSVIVPLFWGPGPSVTDKKSSTYKKRAAFTWLKMSLYGFGIAEILGSVDLDTTIPTDKFRVLVQLVDLRVECGRFQLAHVQFAMLLWIRTVIFGHKALSLVFFKS